MTKEQKVIEVTNIVEAARRFYTLDEFRSMFLAIWNGLETAKNAAVDGGTP